MNLLTAYIMTPSFPGSPFTSYASYVSRLYSSLYLSFPVYIKWGKYGLQSCYNQQIINVGKEFRIVTGT